MYTEINEQKDLNGRKKNDEHEIFFNKNMTS